MDRFCRGERGACEALFDRYLARVRAFLRPMVRDAALAEDLTQSTFLSVVRSKDRYLSGSPLAPWIFTIAANAARSALRRRNLERATQDDAGEEDSVTISPIDHGL